MTCDIQDRQKFRHREYWDARFEEESQSTAWHEWFTSYKSFSHLITPICPPSTTDTILGVCFKKEWPYKVTGGWGCSIKKGAMSEEEFFSMLRFCCFAVCCF